MVFITETFYSPHLQFCKFLLPCIFITENNKKDPQ